jgi:hypothetical protein
MGKKHNKNSKKILCETCKNSECSDRCNVYSCDDYLDHENEKKLNETRLKNIINRNGLKLAPLQEDTELLVRDEEDFQEENGDEDIDFDYDIDGFGPDPDFEIEPQDYNEFGDE